MNMIFKGFAHLFVSTAVTGASIHIAAGAPITSGAVLIPSLIAGLLAVGHAAMPSIINDPSTLPPATTANFPTSK